MRSTGRSCKFVAESLVTVGSTSIPDDVGEGKKGRTGRKKGVKCRPFQVTGGYPKMYPGQGR